MVLSINCSKFGCMFLLLISCVFAYSVNRTQTHKCREANIAVEPKSSLCYKDERKCDVEICDIEMSQCQAIYRNISGKLRHWFFSCFHHGNQECGTDTCPLHYIPNHDLWYCCCKTSLCNTRIYYPLEPTFSILIENASRSIATQNNFTTEGSNYLVLVYILVPLSVVIVLIGLFACIKWKYKKKEDILLVYERDSSKYEYLNIIHQGQFTKLWLVQHQDQKMVVKLLLPTLQNFWTNEREIFIKYNLKHRNIIKFLAAETENINNKLHYLIVVDYYEKGSLVDYLKKNVITVQQMLKFIFSIVRGLVYLHMPESKKPRIAHRDLKSANILITNDLECVICDFGLAIAVDKNNFQTCFDKAQVGTRRYMAPEILDGAIVFNSESYFLMDIYSTALIIWELVSRCNFESEVIKHYQPPYFDQVGENPSIWQMKDCVVDRNVRPPIPLEWRNNTILNMICITMEECWDRDPEARVSANCIHERLLAIKDQTLTETALHMQEETVKTPLLGHNL
ncbi:activin receptor type-2A isoform X1 [Hydra vulgaris]|uniref:Serine/threonine-protein kinase receptor n=2 Tax=Hydra vulgaris TaxID=6087 RepID=A0ABM4CVL1_HYDVU